MLDDIVTNRMINFQYVYDRDTGIVAERKTNEYRFSSPVKHISMEVRRFKFGGNKLLLSCMNITVILKVLCLIRPTMCLTK